MPPRKFVFSADGEVKSTISFNDDEMSRAQVADLVAKEAYPLRRIFDGEVTVEEVKLSQERTQ